MSISKLLPCRPVRFVDFAVAVASFFGEGLFLKAFFFAGGVFDDDFFCAAAFFFGADFFLVVFDGLAARLVLLAVFLSGERFFLVFLVAIREVYHCTGFSAVMSKAVDCKSKPGD